MEFELLTLGLLFAAALTAGLVDAMAGGGGLITIPVLMGAGITPAQALATNKLQASFGSFSAAYYFIRKGAVNLRQMALPIICTFIGAAVGTYAVQLIDAAILKQVIPFLLIVVAGYFFFSKKIKDEDSHQILSLTAFSCLIASVIGFYDGFLGPGTGSFFALSFVSLLGFSISKATAHAKLLNFVSNITSLLVFLLGGEVIWLIGLVMGAGQIIGALIGARLVIGGGVKFIRPIVVIMCIAMSGKMLFEIYGASLFP